MHKITGEEARAMYEHLLLRHADGDGAEAVAAEADDDGAAGRRTYRGVS